MKPAILPLLVPALALAGCVTFRTVDDGIARARIGETVRVGAMSVQPVALVEDSRCPAETQCVWAGRVRILARVDGADTELTLGESKPLAQGRLTLSEVYPVKRKDTMIYPDEYRFGFSASAR